MYFWKCWYSTRWVVAVNLVVIAGMTALVLRHAPIHITEYLNAYTVWRIVSISASLAGLSAWILGSIGISRDIADGSGAYLLSQPRTVRYFAWTDATVALGELSVLAIVETGLFLAALHLLVIRFDTRLDPHHIFAESAPLNASSVTIILLASILSGGVTYAVSYLFTAVLRKPTLSIFLSAAFYLVYTTVSGKAHFYHAWYRWLFPDWRIELSNYPNGIGFSPDLLLAIGGRIAAILLLIFVAQLVIQRVEIKA